MRPLLQYLALYKDTAVLNQNTREPDARQGTDGLRSLLDRSRRAAPPSASYAQAKTVAQPLLANRIAMVLLHLRELTSREGRELDEVQLTHEELACLIACDRASTTRAA